MRSNYSRLGDYIREVNVRNRDLSVTELKGININKQFMPSVANIIGVDLSNYKVVKREQFACNLMHVGRDEKIPIAINNGSDIIVSPAYLLFEVVDLNVVDPQYLMMWFSRSEFDRQAWFYTDADVRGGMTKDSFFDMPLIIPSIEKQRAIVKEYQTLTDRIKLNETLCTKLEQTAQALYRKMFIDNIGPENFPAGWRMGVMSDIVEVRDGTHDSPKPCKDGFPLVTSAHLNAYSINFEETYNISEINYIQINKRSLVETNDILFSMIGTVGIVNYVMYNNINFAIKNIGLFKTSKVPIFAEYILLHLKSKETELYIKANPNGSTQNYVTLNFLRQMPILIPPQNTLCQFSKNSAIIFQQIKERNKEIITILQLKNLMLSRLTI